MYHSFARKQGQSKNFNSRKMGLKTFTYMIAFLSHDLENTPITLYLVFSTIEVFKSSIKRGFTLKKMGIFNIKFELRHYL